MQENNGQDFVRITNREVWEKLGRVEAKLDNTLSQLQKAEEQRADHSKRIRALELRFYGILAGIIATVGSIVGLERLGGG
jgi:hypothetical protein